MTPPVTEVIIGVCGGGTGGGGGGERAADGAGRESSGRGFLGRPRFRFTCGALEVELPPTAPPPDVIVSRGRLVVLPRAFWTTEVGVEGLCCC